MSINAHYQPSRKVTRPNLIAKGWAGTAKKLGGCVKAMHRFRCQNRGKLFLLDACVITSVCVCVSLRYDMAMDQKPVALLNQCSWQMGVHHSKYGVVGF
jgi:hypothetical protein